MTTDKLGSKHAVVTGAAGFIGSHLTESLLMDGYSVLGVDCFNDNYGRVDKLRNLRHLTAWDSFEFVPIDLARGQLGDLVADTGVIYHLAAEPGVRTSWGARYDQYLRNNVLATQHLLEALRETKTRLVYASSSSVYGDTDVRPTPESERLRPRSPYGQTKAAMENLCDLYNANFGVDVVGLRYFTVYGPRQRPDMAFNRICRCLVSGDEFTMFDDGLQTRDFTYVADVVAATRAAAVAQLRAGSRVLNVGGGSPASLAEVINQLELLAGTPLLRKQLPRESGDVRDTAADTSLARTVLGFSPTVGLTEGLAAELEWIREVHA